ncbi:ABC transporter permease [Christiangramia forsetii]|uniref:FtsX family membrane protein (Predicted permease) n=2 Tax=Christiangramia forsetii TaxID=411153 RepID=A0LZ95_CHRFK|nr:ABC transporter permease [Christiangramia forsetii]GGG37794.1 ABC transporter permease [Christiangramia forsetii]CAL65690.1 FtsX family membrane protein (predicted permease) [Christiangramia forsetii KT0803]
MIRHYFKIALRNLRKNKLYSIINIGGLCLGLTACILIMFYVSHEHSYDKFHADSTRIFQLEGMTKFRDQTIYMQNFSPVVAGAMVEKSPWVEAGLRINYEYKPLIVKTVEETPQSFSESNFFYTDQNFFNFFSFNLLQGNKETVLIRPFSVVISEDIAKKYFGNSDPIGKKLEVLKDSTYQFQITGIVENSPSNSSIKSGLITSIATMEKMKEHERNFSSQIFQGGSFATFLKLDNAENLKAVSKTAQILSKQANTQSKDEYLLEAFGDKHLKSRKDIGIKYLDVFPLVAILVLLLALINYMSLTTARADSRAKEVGVRKVNGANKKHIALQFYMESALYVSLSFILAGILSYFLEKPFFNLMDIEIDGAFFFHPVFLAILGFIYLITILLAGIYPSLVMTSFKPIENFRKKSQEKFGGNMVRKICATVQFTIAVVLIIGGFIIKQQMEYLKTLNTGLDRSEILMVPLQKSIRDNSQAFRNKIEKIPGVRNTAISNNQIYDGYDIFYASAKNTESVALPLMQVDDNFLNILDVKWKLEPANDKLITAAKKIVINETAIGKFNLSKDPRGEFIELAGSKQEIVGVVKDFNYASLENPIDALGLKISKRNEFSGTGCLYIKYSNRDNLPELISNIAGSYKKYDSEAPFDYQFMDDKFNALFKSEERLSRMFSLFIILTIIIAGLGLLGLATFSAQQRVKEIGVRKILGASVFQITTLLSKDFIKLTALAVLIASPVAWFLANEWLQGFAYQTKIEWPVFFLSGVFAVSLALFIVCFQAIRAARANPVKNLRTE